MFRLFEASDFKIFVRKTKILKEGKQATTSLTQSWPAKFIDDVSYYFLSSTEEIAYEVNKKNLIPHSKEDNEKLLKFAKSRKLNLDNENDIIEIYEYYNSSINN